MKFSKLVQALGNGFNVIYASSFRKRKGEKERYTYLNTEFHRIARGDKKAFLSEQSKEIEENTKKGKASDFFKKS